MPVTARPTPCGRVERLRSVPSVSQLTNGPSPMSAAALAAHGVPSIAQALSQVSWSYYGLLGMLSPFSCGSHRLTHAANCTRTSACEHGEFDIVVLATYPRSGTGWTQTTYSAASGLRWETVYNIDQANRTAYGTYEFTKTIGTRTRHGDEPAFVKTHFPDWGCPPPSFGPKTCIVARAVHLIRNPLDQILAMYRGIAGVTASSRNASWQLPAAVRDDWLRMAPALARSYVRWHCRAAIAFRERPVLLVRYDDLIADPTHEYTRLLSFVLGQERAPAAVSRLTHLLARPGSVRHVEPTTPLRGAFPVYAHDHLATPAAVSAIAQELDSALSLGVWANAIAADSAEGNETVLGPNGAGPLYPWKVACKTHASAIHATK